MIIPGKKIKISLNVDRNVLKRLDEEIKIYFKDEYTRLQRSRMIEYIKFLLLQTLLKANHNLFYKLVSCYMLSFLKSY